MHFKWVILIIGLIVLLFFTNCYWLPVLKSTFQNGKSAKSNSIPIPPPNAPVITQWKESKEIMPFIGAKNYEESRQFYTELGFQVEEGEKYCRVKVNENLSFWLQNYYHKDWVNNSMVFLSVPDIGGLRDKLLRKDFQKRYQYVRISEIKTYEWGKEIFVHDPSGILWHFCQFNE